MKQKVKKPIYKKWWFYLILVLFVGAIASGSGDDTPKSGGQTDTGKETEKEEKTVFKLDEVISYKDFDLIVSNQREVKGLGSDVYTVFDVEVISKKDGFSFFGDFQGVNSDNEVISNTIAFVSDDLGDPVSIAFTKTLDTDQKLKGYVAFDKPISKLELMSSAFSNKKITIELD